MKPNFDSLYVIAENQAGYFTSSQARAAGYSWERLSNLTKASRFIRVEKGIYRLKNFPNSRFEDLFMAVLKSGSGAVLSHDTALSVYEISDALPGMIHMIIPKNRSRRRKNIKYHNLNLNPDEITKYQGLPVTDVDRTILDVIKSGGDAIQVDQAITNAIKRGLTTREKLMKDARNYSQSIQSRVNHIIERMGH